MGVPIPSYALLALMYHTWYLYARTRSSAYVRAFWPYVYTFVAAGLRDEGERCWSKSTERREAGCRAPRQMRRRVSIASVLQRNWSVICVRAGPVVTLLFLSCFFSPRFPPLLYPSLNASFISARSSATTTVVFQRASPCLAFANASSSPYRGANARFPLRIYL